MQLVFLDKDPYLRLWVRDRLHAAFPHCEVQVTDDPTELPDTDRALLIYTAEQFPELHPADSARTCILHSPRPDRIDVGPELLDDDPSSVILLRNPRPDDLWQTLHTWIEPHLPHNATATGITALTLPVTDPLGPILKQVVAERAAGADQVLLIPVMPAYLWPLFCAADPEPVTVSDLLLDLSIRHTDRTLPDLAPYLCPSDFDCMTLRPPRHADDWTTLNPEVFRRFLSRVHAFLEDTQGEHWDALIVHYGVPFRLARVTMALADRYYRIRSPHSGPSLTRWSAEAEQLETVTRADCRALPLDLGAGVAHGGQYDT